MVIGHPDTQRTLRPLAVLAVAVLAAASVSCAMFKKFDVGRIHEEAAARVQRNPVIFIHGFVGSKLRHRNTHETVWGRFFNAIKRGKTDDLSLPIDRLAINDNRDDLVPYAICESVAGVKFYGAILDALREVGGYRLGDIRNPTPGDTAFVYTYDWRRDNVESAIGLGRAIRQIKSRLGNPDLRFDIVAHSMGGLVAEYYLKYGMVDVLSDGRDGTVTYAGAPDIGRLVQIGTPFGGTMSAFRILNTGVSRSMSPAVIFTMPSIYQLLPNESRGHFVDPDGNDLEVDLYDADTWVRNGWSIFNRQSDLEKSRRGRDGAGEASPREADIRARQRDFLQAVLDRSRAFQAALRRDTESGSPVPIHLFGSDCFPTLDRVVLKSTPSGSRTYFDDESSPDRNVRDLERMLMVPGDGTVTAESLLALDGDGEGIRELRRSTRTFTSTFFFCETHGLLPAHRGFQDNLFHVLFHSPERPTATAGVIGSK